MSANKMNSTCRAAVIIPAYNERDAIIPCLESIALAQLEVTDEESIEIIVVDNDSSDNTAQIARSFSKEIANLHVIYAQPPGTGHARRAGAQVALSRARERPLEMTKAFWLITTDADAIVPRHWLTNWLREVSSATSMIITGNSDFGPSFSSRYPNSAKLLTLLGQRIRRAERLFGVINVDGFNTAIERTCYATAGPYLQPQRLTKTDSHVNLAGEDWYLSTRARALGFPPSRAQFEPVTVSPRRFEASPRAFLEGTAYEQPFEKVEIVSPAPDIERGDIQDLLALASRRQCMHYVEKPILVTPSLLRKPSVTNALGERLVKEMMDWIGSTNGSDILSDIEYFIEHYLHMFHEEYSAKITQELFEKRMTK